jgi:capsule polysaccharide export protein KpsE/RkpR
MENYFNNINLFQAVFKWKWHIIIICLIAGILAALFSGPAFIKPRFKSTAIIYPSNIAPYSDESETEQMLQWLNSKDIKDSVINRFDLAKHYDLDPEYKYFYSTLLYYYGRNVSINKTMYESVEIEVMDTDPVVAYKMVNAIIEFYNKKIARIHKKKYDEVVTMWEKMLELKKAELDSVADHLYDLRTEYELIDYGHQAREVTRGYLGTVDGDNAARNVNMEDVLRMKENIEEMGGEFVVYNTRLYDLLILYRDLQKEYDAAYYDANKEFSYTNIVSEPVVADKKSYPTRWLIVFYAMAATLVLLVVLILFFEGRRSQKKTETKPA